VIDIEKIDFKKYSHGLVPSVIQDNVTGKVLMLGFMSKESIAKTLEIQKVTFFSRSRNELWTKGQTSGNFLELKSICMDCDFDTLLVQAHPLGPVCHTGSETCFEGDNSRNSSALGFLSGLERVIEDRRESPDESSYTSRLFKSGTPGVAQKVGEEAVEVVIEAIKGDKARFKEESADLLFHFLVLLKDQGFELADIVKVLEGRNAKN